MSVLTVSVLILSVLNLTQTDSGVIIFHGVQKYFLFQKLMMEIYHFGNLNHIIKNLKNNVLNIWDICTQISWLVVSILY